MNETNTRTAGSGIRPRSLPAPQRHAVELWEQFRNEELHFADMLELCAVLMVNVADKAKCSDMKVNNWTKKLVRDMRTNASQKAKSQTQP